MTLTVQNVTKHYTEGGETLAVDDVSVRANRGEILCLLGPSGCGKTTLLRMIAGLETPDTGAITLDGADITRLPVHKRDFGLMFQDFALFPHLNVRQNVAFGLEMKGLSKEERRARISEVLDLVGLGGFGDRGVDALSGGERQRVALARSLAPQPRLLMLDEPLGSLDRVMRERLMLELRDILKRVSLTAVYVTHDQEEAFAIADRVAVMRAGRIEQVGTPEDLYWHPASPFVARFIGLENLLPGTVDRESAHIKTRVGQLPLPSDAAAIGKVTVLIHPAGISVGGCADYAECIEGEIAARTFRGSTYHLTVAHDSGERLAVRLAVGPGAHIPEMGERVSLGVSADAVRCWASGR